MKKMKINDKVLVIAKYTRTNEIGVITLLDSYECTVMFEDGREEKFGTNDIMTKENVYEQIIEATEKIGQLRTCIALLTTD